MMFPDPGEKPVTFGELPEGVQVNELPATWERMLMADVCAEHKVCAMGE